MFSFILDFKMYVSLLKIKLKKNIIFAKMHFIYFYITHIFTLYIPATKKN